jgi:CheY-like chemotaxis protein
MNDSIGRTAAGCKRILVVEDTQSVAEFLREMLQAFGHHAEISLSVQQALAAFEPGKYDLVITDYTMPGMNGIEFARRIKQQSAGQVILLITGSTFSLADSAPGEMPVEAVLQKPFSVKEFQDMLALLLAPRPTPATEDALSNNRNHHDQGHPSMPRPRQSSRL